MKSLADKYICTNTNHHECETHQRSWSKCLHIVTQIPQAGLAAVRDAVSPNREQFLARFQTKQHPALFLNLNNRYLSRNVGFYSSHAKNIFVFISMHAQSCPTLCNPKARRPPGSSVHGILQAGILGWVAISFSRRSS